jgi:predicted metalloprotease with PDZ domain
MAGVSLASFFEKYVFGTEDYEMPLAECFKYLNIDYVKNPSPQISEHLFGFKTVDFGLNRKISLIAPYSPAWKAGLSIGDEIIAVNGYTLKNDFNDWMQYFKDSNLELTISSSQCVNQIKLFKKENGLSYFGLNKLKNSKEMDTYVAWKLINS